MLSYSLFQGLYIVCPVSTAKHCFATNYFNIFIFLGNSLLLGIFAVASGFGKSLLVFDTAVSLSSHVRALTNKSVPGMIRACIIGVGVVSGRVRVDDVYIYLRFVSFCGVLGEFCGALWL